MPIADRKLKPGTVLVARYKGEEHRAEVVKTKEGLRYKLKDGREFKSPSSAGAAVKGGGKTCDGWEFWSVEGGPAVPPRAQRKTTEQPTRPKPRSQAKAKPKRAAKAKAKKEGEGKIARGDCGQEFDTSREAADHMRDEHNSQEAAPGQAS